MPARWRVCCVALASGCIRCCCHRSPSPGGYPPGFSSTALRHRAVASTGAVRAERLNEITHCLFWSMTFSIGAYLYFFDASPAERQRGDQATLFVDVLKHERPFGIALWRGKAEVHELSGLAERFLGVERGALCIRPVCRAARGRERRGSCPRMPRWCICRDPAGWRNWQCFVAGDGGLGDRGGGAFGLDEVLDILDEASQIRAYSRELGRSHRNFEAATRELKAANEQ